MTNDEIDKIMLDITAGAWPEDPIIPVGEPFKNDAGAIINLAWGTFGSASLIISKAGAVRSNHFHKTDWHFIHVLDGTMLYYWRPAGSTATPERRRCKMGTLVFTPPGVEHATFFPEHTAVVTFNKRTRDHESHEADLVRLEQPIVTSEVCPAVSSGVRCCLPWQHVEGRDFRNPVHAGDHESLDGRTFSFGLGG